MDFDIELYENQNGRPVVREELLAIKERQAALYALLLAGLDKLRSRENHHPPLTLSLGSGLFEVRVGHRDIARALWFFRRGQRIVVVRCFTKKSQKTPEGELTIAAERMKDYLARHANL